MARAALGALAFVLVLGAGLLFLAIAINRWVDRDG